MNEETKIENKACKKILSELGVVSIKLNVKANTGWPDRLFLIPTGIPLLIEFKQPGKDLRPKQEYIHNLLKMYNYKVEVHDDAERAFQAVARAMAAI